MAEPSPLVAADIRLATDPLATDPLAPGTREIVKRLFTCAHCTVLTSDGKHRCVMDKYRTNFVICCGAVDDDEGQDDKALFNSRCRSLMYYHMALICLVPFEKGERKVLPLCVVKEIHAVFPDPKGLHRKEFEITFQRKHKNLLMQTKSKPSRFPYF